MLKVGDKVTTDYWQDEKSVVRKITAIGKDGSFGSGYFASADNGGICPCCKKPFGTEIRNVDMAWFKKVEGQ